MRGALPGRVALVAAALVALAACSSSPGSTGGTGTVALRIVPAGCDPTSVTVPAGRTTFEVTNVDAPAVTELELLDGAKVLGEAENLAPGLRGSFTVDLVPGTYTIWCPGGTTVERGTLTVTGSASASASASGEPAGALVAVTLKDFSIEPTPTTALPGPITFRVTDAGPSAHEMVVLRTDLPPASLPVEDGVVVEDAPGITSLGELEFTSAGTESDDLSLTLDPGTYVLICNLPGHYQAGMHAALTVSP